MVERFHIALRDGDRGKIGALLDTAAMVLENGIVENKTKYLHDHLPEDIAFAQAVPSRRTTVAVIVQGNAAWVSTTSAVRGTFDGKPVKLASAELMVLSRSRPGARWRISTIHWSSHRSD